MRRLKSPAVVLSALTLACAASAQVTLYEDDGYRGETITTNRPMPNLRNRDFNDRASSAVVAPGRRFEVCQDARFEGRCVVLRPGNYPTLASMGLNDRVSSVRPIGDSAYIEESRYAPLPVVREDWRARRGERLFEADVLSVRAVMGTPERRCWIEREEVRGERGDPNVGGAVLGAVIGGILGHQVGGGSGRDAATVGGAVVGGAVGANVNRDGRVASTRDVQRCSDNYGNRRPDYYDVIYRFRGQEHHVQMTTPPGPTVTVNRLGEPRAPQG